MTPNEPDSQLERATESTMAKVVARFVMPGMLAIIGWFVIDGVTDLRQGQKEQGIDIVQIKSDIRDVNTRLDAQVLRQVETNSKLIGTLDDRLQRIERRLGEFRDQQ